MKKMVFLMMISIIVVGLESGMPLQNNVVKQDAPFSGPKESSEMADLSRSLVSGAFEFTGPTYVLPNIEYTYTIERTDSYVDGKRVELQILDPNTTATLTEVGEVTYKFICSSQGAYYIRVTGTHGGVDYSFDSYPIICVYWLPFPQAMSNVTE